MNENGEGAIAVERKQFTLMIMQTNQYVKHGFPEADYSSESAKRDCRIFLETDESELNRE